MNAERKLPAAGRMPRGARTSGTKDGMPPAKRDRTRFNPVDARITSRRQTEPWDDLGMSRRTYFRRKAEGSIGGVE